MENIDKSNRNEIYNALFGGEEEMQKNILEFAKKLEIARRTDRSGTVWPTFHDYLKYGDLFIELKEK